MLIESRKGSNQLHQLILATYLTASYQNGIDATKRYIAMIGEDVSDYAIPTKKQWYSINKKKLQSIILHGNATTVERRKIN
jgi:hypothetical protein